MKAFLNLFEQRVRGIRLIELVGIGLALAMVFWVCLSKAREGEDIKRMNLLDQQIAEESTAVAQLKIKVSDLERPSRLEALATQYLNMKPVEPAYEAPIESLGEISRTTSRAITPVRSVATPAPAVAVPAVAPAAAGPDDLISTAGSSKGSNAVAPAAKTGSAR